MDVKEQISIEKIEADFKICQKRYPIGCAWGECKKCGVPLAYYKLITDLSHCGEVSREREMLIKKGLRIYLPPRGLC